MIERGEDSGRAQRYVLRRAAVMFASRAGLPDLGLPVSEDLPEVSANEASLLERAADLDWSKVGVGVFGAARQAMMAASERRGRGAHYTPLDAIFDHIVRPSLTEPWRARIRRASSIDDLLSLRLALAEVRVLDPACGSGDFLVVVYRELMGLERELIRAINDRRGPARAEPSPLGVSVRPTQLFGIDKDPLAVELAKLTLVFAAAREMSENAPSPSQLDANIRCDDALFCPWPAADLIVGNPPFQSKNKARRELGSAYMERVRRSYPLVPGRADYCVYWLRRAHDELAEGARAGFVGTNTIRENDSRKGGLDSIVANGGTITDAVSTMTWPGQANVHVSIVNWVKGSAPGPAILRWQEGEAPRARLREAPLERISSSLSPDVDVTSASALAANASARVCYQGQTHGHEGFILSAEEARLMIAADPSSADVLFPYLIGEELLTEPGGAPRRWVIDLHPRSEAESRRYTRVFSRIERLVLPDRERAAERERERDRRAGSPGGQRRNKHHEGFLRRFWLLSYPRAELIQRLGLLSRYIACSRVAKRPIFEFIASAIRPSDALAVFTLEDDYSFGILQSSAHWAWVTARGSSLTARRRYTSDTVFDSFPWPQGATSARVAAVAKAAAALRAERRALTSPTSPTSPTCSRGMSLRALYTSIEGPGRHPLKEAHAALDEAVRAAYGAGPRDEPLALLLDLNRACAAREALGLPILGPGLPATARASGVVTDDAVAPPVLLLSAPPYR